MAPTSYPLPSMPADLDSLKEFASVQNQRIQKLLEREAGAMPRHFTVSPQQGWKAVWKATWGLGNGIFEGNEEVVRDSDSDAIDNSLLPDPIPSHCNIATKPPGLDAAWRFACKKLFVRAEYDVAQAAAVQLCGYNEGSYPFDVLVFSGQSGIGSPPFFCTVDHTVRSSSWLRKINLLVPPSVAPPRGRAPHRIANSSRMCPPVLRGWRAGVWTTKRRRLLLFTGGRFQPPQQDLDVGGFKPTPHSTHWRFRGMWTLLCRSCGVPWL